jgi:DnaK suppressor protein
MRRNKVTKQSRLDPAFLDRQRRRLLELRSQIMSSRRREEAEQADANAEVNDQPHEYEDDAQRLTTVELQGNLAAVDDERLIAIERALKKIDEGTYGLSEASGKPIPTERLEASPEAIYTVEEQKARDERS